MFPKPRLAVILCAALAAGCGSDSAGPEAASDAADGSTLPGVYSGTFPCGNCPGIDVTLWLTDDGLFFLRQDFVASDDADAERIHALGHWRWSPADATLTLAGRGPDREFFYYAGERLEMSTFSSVPHVLEKVQDAGQFVDRVRLEGTYAPGRDGETFAECITGLQLSIADDAGRRALRSRHRTVSKPEVPALTVVDARLIWDGEERTDYVIAVDEVISMRPRSTCTG